MYTVELAAMVVRESIEKSFCAVLFFLKLL